MSVEIEVENGLLAGSERINSHPDGSTDTETPLSDPGANAGQDGIVRKRGRGPGKRRPTGKLLLLCSRCQRAIRGPGQGFAFCDLRECHKAAVRTAAGYIDPAKARWTLAHRGCASEAVQALTPYHLVWAGDISTVDALLDTMAGLSASPWFAWSDWGSLVRGVMADTETAAIDDDEATVARRTERAAARAKGLPPGDPRHGTPNGYSNYGCRCSDCSGAKSDLMKANRERQTQERPC